MRFKKQVLLGVALAMATLSLWLVARAAGSWRPTALGTLVSGSQSVDRIGIEPNRVMFGGQDEKGRIFGEFDLGSAKVSKVTAAVPRRFGVNGVYAWSYLMGEDTHHLEVTDEQGATRRYSVDGLYTPQRNDELPVRVLAARNRVLMFSGDRALEWDLTSGRLVENSERPGDTLSRDGATFIGRGSDGDSFEIGDVATGKITRTIPWRTPGSMEYDYFSAYGRYCLFDTRDGTFRVVEVATGKVLWRFASDFVFNFDALMADDEKIIVVHEGNQWLVRDFQTGAIARRLPYVAGLEVAALSPDGLMLYSVAKGVLYRQRTR